MTTAAERQMELTLPMVEDIEIAAARAAGNLARELGMSTQSIDEMTHAIVEPVRSSDSFQIFSPIGPMTMYVGL